MAAPDINSNYYIMQSYGGWSPCIEGNNTYGLLPFAGSVLPNCVGYICGRFNELLHENACTYFGSVNARNLYALGVSQGLSTGNDPVVGGVICFDTDYLGHAVVIESIIDNDTVVVSESGWRYTTGPVVKSYTMYRVNGVWQYQGGTYQGIVYPPVSVGTDDYYMLFLDEEGFN